MSSVNGTPSVPPPPTFSTSNKFNPSMAIIIVVLIGALLVVLIFSMYIRRCTRGAEDNSSNNRVSQSRTGNQSIHFFERPGEGLEKALVDALPVVSFAVVKTLKVGKEDLECSVCLEKFTEDEALRLLPKCSHVFHTECIDVWFLSHSTCPLCRTSLKPTFEEISAGVPEVGEVSRRILVAQELFGSGRAQPPDHTDTPLHEDEALEGSSGEVGRGIGMDGERNSARLALFRNSDSFRQAARGVEVRERLATLSARYPASSVDVEKAPQRASSLSCVNFALQRTSSSGDAAAGAEFYNTEVLFKYGSQRYGATGSSLGRLGSLNERGLQETGPDLKPMLQSEPTEEASSSASSEELSGDTPKAPVSVNFDNPDVSTTPDSRQLPGKPRSGPLTGKQVSGGAHRKSGSGWEQRVRTERGSFRGLRGSFSLHRSASEGRAQIFAVEPLSTPTEVNVDGSARSRSDASTPLAGIDNNTSTFAQRTIQWLSGGSSKHTRSSSARSISSDPRNDPLQQIVTE